MLSFYMEGKIKRSLKNFAISFLFILFAGSMLPSNSSAAPFDGGGGSYAQKIPFKVFIRDPNNQNAWVIASCVPVHVRKLTESGALDNSWQYDVNPGGEQDYNLMVNDNYRVPFVFPLVFPPTSINEGFGGQYNQTQANECLNGELNNDNEHYMHDLRSTLGGGLRLPSFVDRFGNGTVLSAGITGYRVYDNGEVDTRTARTTGPSRALPDGTYRIFTDAYKDGITRFNQGTTAKNWINSAFNGEDRIKGSIEIEIKDGELQNLPSGGYYSLFLNETSDKSVWERLGISNPIEAALKTVFGGLMNGLEKFIGYMITAIDSMLNWTETQALNNSIKTVNTNMRNLGISFLVIILVLIAFTNALQIRVDQYGINRMIPKIIIAIIMAYFSWIIVQFFFDFASALQGEARSIVGSNGDWSTMFSGGSGLDGVVGIGNMIFVIIIFVIAVIIVGALLFSLLLRTVFLAFLIAVAPLAMIMSILPFSERYYKKWWSEFFKWLFMGPLVVFLLALGTVLAGGTPPTLNGASVVSGSGDTFLGLLMMLGAMIFAASLPVTLGGKYMQQWRGAGKGARDYLANRGFERLGRLGERPGKENKWLARSKYLAPDTAKSFWKNRQQVGKSRREESGKELQGKLAGREGKGAGLSRFAAGVTSEEAIGKKNRAQLDWAKAQNPDILSAADKQKRRFDAYKRGDMFQAEAWTAQLGSEGLLTTGLNEDLAKELGTTEEALKATNQEMVDKFAPTNGGLQGSLSKEHNELMISSNNPSFRARGVAKAAKDNPENVSADVRKALGTVARSKPDKTLPKEEQEKQQKVIDMAAQALEKTGSTNITRTADRGNTKQLESMASKEVLGLMKGEEGYAPGKRSSKAFLDRDAMVTLRNKLKEKHYDTLNNGKPTDEWIRVNAKLEEMGVKATQMTSTPEVKVEGGGSRGATDQGEEGTGSVGATLPPRPQAPSGGTTTAQTPPAPSGAGPTPQAPDYGTEPAPTTAPSQVINQTTVINQPASYEQRIAALPVGLRPKSGRTLTEEDLSLLENMLRKRPTTHEARVQDKSDILKKGVDPSDGVLDTLDWLQGPAPSQQPPVDSIKPTDTGSDNVNGPEE